jgi:hypothetical protein
MISPGNGSDTVYITSQPVDWISQLSTSIFTSSDLLPLPDPASPVQTQ